MISHLYCCLVGQEIRRRRRSKRFNHFIEPAQCVAILAPHMDDEIIGCAGLMHRYVQQGTRVMIVYLTDGAHALRGKSGKGATGNGFKRVSVPLISSGFGIVSCCSNPTELSAQIHRQGFSWRPFFIVSDHRSSFSPIRVILIRIIVRHS